MRWNNKKRKIFIFIVSLLIILQIFSVLGMAGEIKDLLDNLDPGGNKEEPNIDEKNSTGDETGDDGSYSSSSTGSSSSTSTSNTDSSSSQSTLTDSGSSDLDSSNDLQLDPKYSTYESALSSASISEETEPVLTYHYYEQPSVLEVTLTSNIGPISEATVTVIGRDLTTDDDGKIQASIPPKVVESSKNILIEASTNGYYKSTYAYLAGEKTQTDINALLEFIQNMGSSTLRIALMEIFS